MKDLKLSFLGPPVVEFDGRTIHLETRKATAVLAYLCLNPPAVPREVLAALLWPEFDPQHTQANLRRCLHSVNHSLQSRLLLSEAGAVGINDPTSCGLDVREFRRRLAVPRTHAHREAAACPDCRTALEQAAVLYRADFLSGFNLPDCPEFDEWQSFQRESLRQELAEGLDLLSSLYAARSEWGPAIAHARRWVSLDRLHEPAQRRLIQLYLQSGQRSAARRQYEECACLLQEELGQSPGEETRLLVRPENSAPTPKSPTAGGSAAGSAAGSGAQPVPAGIPVLKTKLFIPRTRQTAVPRPRLVERIDRGVQGPLTLISAPAGYGKTTLLVEWAGHSPLPVAWFSVDGGDNDPARFLTYLIASLDSLFDGIGRDGLLLLQSTPPASPTAVIARVVKDLEAAGDPFVLVLDDYQFIHEHPVHGILTFLLENLPVSMHLLIASRSDPPLPLSRLRARNQLVELRASDLRLMPEEAEQFLNRVMGLGLDSGDLSTLAARTEGWAVGLQMAALALQGVGESRSRFIQSFSGSHRYVLDYLVDEVLSHQPDDIQAFLLQTSILERLCAPLCDAVIESREWRIESSNDSPLSTLYSQEVLEYLDRSNLFLVPLDEERTWYRYHHLFAGLLRGRLKRLYPGHVRMLHERASAWYEREGMIDDAVRHSLAAGNTERAAGLVSQHGLTMVANGKMSTIQNWLDALPQQLIQEEPRLCLVQAWVWSMLSQVQGVEPLLERAETLIHPAAPEARDLRGNIVLLRAYLAVMEGKWERAIDLCLSARELLPEQSVPPRWLLHILMGDAHLITGDIDLCCQAYRDAYACSRNTENIYLRLVSLDNLAMAYRLQGRLHDAERVYQEGIRQAVEWGGPQTIFLGGPRIGYSTVLYEWNDLDGARQQAEAGVRGAEQVGGANLLVLGYRTLVQIYQAQGDRERAGQMIDKAEQWTRSYTVFPHTASMLQVTKIRHRLAAGTLEETPDGPAGLPVGEDVPLRLPDLLELAGQARIWIARGEGEQALPLLARLAQFAQARGLHDCLIEIELLHARVLLDSGETAESMRIFETCVSRAEGGGYLRTFIDEGQPVLKLIQEYREQVLAGRCQPPAPGWVDTLEKIASSVSGRRF